MTEPVLSPEEVAALRDNIHAKGETPLSVDLLSSERALRRNAMRFAENLETFWESFSQLLTKTTRVTCKVQTQPFEVLSKKGMSDALRGLGMLSPLTMDHSEVGFWGVPVNAGFFVIEHLFEAEESAPQPTQAVERTRFTEIEQHLLRPIVDDTTRLLGECARCVFQKTSTFLAASQVEKWELVALWRIQCAVNGQTLEWTLAMSAQGLERLVGDNRQPLTNRAAQRSLELNLEHAAVTVSAELGSVSINVAELLALRAGDVLRLDKGREELLPLSVEGNVKFLGKPVQRGHVFGVSIEEVCR